MRARRAAGGIALACALLAGCGTAPVAYQARPLDPAALATATPGPLPPHPAAWSEAELFAQAVDRAPAVRQALAALKAARLQSVAARTKAPIGLTLSTEYANEAGAESPWLFGLGLDIPLDRGAARLARLSTADLPVVRARYALAAAVWKVEADLHRAFIDSQYGRLVSTQAQSLVQLRQQVLALTAARVAAGEDRQAAQRQAAAALSTAERELALAQVRADAAYRLLEDAIFVRQGGLAGAQLRPIAAPNSQPIPPYPAALQAAMLTRPEILEALVAYDEAEAGLRGEVARQYPTISLQPGFTWERGLTKLPFNLSLSLPPRDRNRAAIDAAEAARAAAGLGLEAAQSQVRAQADAAYYAWTEASARARRLNTTELTAARGDAEAAARLSAAGETSRVDTLQAELALAEIQRDAVDAQYQAWLARAALEAALQTSFDSSQTADLNAKIQGLGAE